MEIEINLNNKEQAAKEVKKIQGAIDDLLGVIDTQKAELLKQVEVVEDAHLQITNLTKTAVELADALKAVHRILGNKKDLFKDDEEMKVIMDSLATFVLGSGAIKLGVISKAMEDENESNN